jgi:hypothetical protein
VRVAGWLDDSKTIVVLMQLTSRGIENGWQASLVVAGRAAAAAIWTCDLMHIELTIMRDYRK